MANANPISRGFCWMARDGNAAMREIGFIACDDPAAESNQPVPENLTDHERERISALLALMEEIRRPGKKRIGSEADKCLHIAAVGVAPGYEGAGIATSLLQKALADATARGFTHAFSECTSIASRKCHEKIGFQSLHCVAVNKFSVNGAYPFSRSTLAICLLWKDLAKRAC
ncbi:GNAT family N-acetyltransferase [Desulfobulbus alkaliphilus]|uniref:GNAT family N-acetyltransferase n=1 Tax=Desulfobulbus alkaliphilus TaxID=869814 RepID=UPI00196334F2|nr:GNAT family N-acetyltransferase [Desulfobulbus alkaliphilus]MBM9537542.1 GNAT family N-acetyltransferase [Desulfobulbus alkaliphilus]